MITPTILLEAVDEFGDEERAILAHLPRNIICKEKHGNGER